ncbi:MAG: hypothetical protein MJ189_05325, partial [Coriobacteriales bacterium]|nr:hypothetical protein [Coriobacteriales bacterium]
MIDEKNLNNLSPQDLEKASGGLTPLDEPVYSTLFLCPSCSVGSLKKGDYSKMTDYDPPKCSHCGADMVICTVRKEYWQLGR